MISSHLTRKADMDTSAALIASDLLIVVISSMRWPAVLRLIMLFWQRRCLQLTRAFLECLSKSRKKYYGDFATVTLMSWYRPVPMTLAWMSPSVPSRSSESYLMIVFQAVNRLI